MIGRLNDIYAIETAEDLLMPPLSIAVNLAQQGEKSKEKLGHHWGIYRPRFVKWNADELLCCNCGEVGTDG